MADPTYDEQVRQARLLQAQAFAKAMGQIDPTELEEFQRGRSERGTESLGHATMMSAQGPESLRPLARALAAQGFEERSPLAMGEGIVSDGRYVADPAKVRSREATAMQGQAGALLSAAGEGETQKGRVLARALQQRTLDTPLAKPENWARLSDDTLYNQVTGETRPVTGGPGGAPVMPKLTEGQSNAVMYGRRAAQADQILNDIGMDYSTTAVNAPGAITNALEKLPFGIGRPIAGGAGTLINAASGAKTQQVSQAQRNFLNAVLRKESGATITPEEFANGSAQYFPAVGDGPEVLAQKAANRRAAVEGLMIGSGPGAGFVAREMQAQPGAAAAGPTAAPSRAQRGDVRSRIGGYYRD